ncbi:hypothetical protein PAHAL_5G367300 [Panicum hallii]|uniref:Uncharacterized protein n=1 Tax=Panicum hallii TaxID=206008 RepID=A0A2T8IMD9_9POAL|nr:hypothetical protein PAHAL_5G367300 [Panicum hallii]
MYLLEGIPESFMELKLLISILILLITLLNAKKCTMTLFVDSSSPEGGLPTLFLSLPRISFLLGEFIFFKCFGSIELRMEIKILIVVPEFVNRSQRLMHWRKIILPQKSYLLFQGLQLFIYKAQNVVMINSDFSLQLMGFVQEAVMEAFIKLFNNNHKQIAGTNCSISKTVFPVDLVYKLCSDPTTFVPDFIQHQVLKIHEDMDISSADIVQNFQSTCQRANVFQREISNYPLQVPRCPKH